MPDLMEELKIYGELLKGIDYDIVTLHPLGDETELLAKLDLTPEQIIICDLYWVFKNRLFFVTIGCNFFTSAKFVSHHRRLDIEHGHRFTVNTNVSPLTKNIINNCLHYLATWIENNNSVLAETDKNALLYQSLRDDSISTPSRSATILISTSDIAVIS